MYEDEIQIIDASIEVAPKQIVAQSDFASLFPPGCRVYLPDIGGEALDTFIDAAALVSDAGYVAVPHIPARRIANNDELALRLQRYAEEAGVYDVLIIGGDSEQPVGDFASTMDLLETGLFDRYSIEEIGIAGHPEGSPNFDEETAYEALRLKQAFAERTGAHMRIVTQFGFNAGSIIHWSECLSDHDVELPVHVGVTGPAKLSTLVKYAMMCGVGPSLDFLKKRLSAIATLASGFDPEIVATPIEEYASDTQFEVIKQIHVFPFGGVKRAARWLRGRESWW